MAREADIHSFEGQRVTIGLSSIIGITLTAGQVATLVKYLSGGTLEFGGASLSWGQGYVVSANEAVAADSSGTLYACATGSTVVVCILRGKSSGFA